MMIRARSKNLGAIAAKPASYVPPAERCELLSARGWTLHGASVRGLSHEVLGEMRQDQFHQCIVGRRVAIVVGDGLGSCAHAHAGAEIVTRAVCGGLRTLLALPCNRVPVTRDALVRRTRDGEAVTWGSALVGIIEEARAKVGAEDGAFDTTLIVAVAGAEGEGVFAHCGDGCAIAFTGEAFEVAALSPPENGGDPCVTFPVTMPDYRAHLRFTWFAGASLLALMTDGTTFFALDPEETRPREGFLQPIADYLATHPNKEGARALLMTLARGPVHAAHGDDKTLVMARRQCGS